MGARWKTFSWFCSEIFGFQTSDVLPLRLKSSLLGSPNSPSLSVKCVSFDLFLCHCLYLFRLVVTCLCQSHVKEVFFLCLLYIWVVYLVVSLCLYKCIRGFREQVSRSLWMRGWVVSSRCIEISCMCRLMLESVGANLVKFKSKLVEFSLKISCHHCPCFHLLLLS